MARLSISPPIPLPLSAKNGGTGLDNTGATLSLTGSLTINTSGGNFSAGAVGGATLSIAANKTLTANNSLTLAGTDGKTLTLDNSLELAGTDGTKMTFPTTSATIARTDAAQTFTGLQTFGSLAITSNAGLNLVTGTHAGTTTLCTLGRTGGAQAPTTAAMAIWCPFTDTTNSVTGYIPVWH